MEANPEFLEVKNLNVIYTSDGSVIHAVNDVSFSLKKGETLGLVGETGAGKTTIAKSILRILPNPPAKVMGGEILLEGVDLLQLSERQMRTIRGGKISMIFQDPMTALNPVEKIGDQILEGYLLHNKVDRETGKKRAEEMLEMVGIPKERYGEYPHQFSGGMKQRVVIAMALACNPSLLLADEPTTALDVTIQAQVLEMIVKLREQLQTSMVLITHDLGVVAEVCDNVAVIYAGMIVEMGSKEQIFLRPTHPYTKGLFASLPSLSNTEKRLNPIKGLPPDPSNLPEGCCFSPRCPLAKDECRKGCVPDLLEIEPGHYCRCTMQRKEEITHD